MKAGAAGLKRSLVIALLNLIIATVEEKMACPLLSLTLVLYSCRLFSLEIYSDWKSLEKGLVHAEVLDRVTHCKRGDA